MLVDWLHAHSACFSSELRDAGIPLLSIISSMVKVVTCCWRWGWDPSSITVLDQTLTIESTSPICMCFSLLHVTYRKMRSSTSSMEIDCGFQIPWKGVPHQIHQMRSINFLPDFILMSHETLLLRHVLSGTPCPIPPLASVHSVLRLWLLTTLGI